MKKQHIISNEIIHSSTKNKQIKDEDIQKKAYELAEKRGFVPGHELDDWFEAQKQLDQCRN